MLGKGLALLTVPVKGSLIVLGTGAYIKKAHREGNLAGGLWLLVRRPYCLTSVGTAHSSLAMFTAREPVSPSSAGAIVWRGNPPVPTT